jgi:hypothetical protein
VARGAEAGGTRRGRGTGWLGDGAGVARWQRGAASAGSCGGKIEERMGKKSTQTLYPRSVPRSMAPS